MPLTDEDVLEHFGIKGMRWGVRRSEKQLARAQEAKDREEKSSSDYKESQAAKAKIKNGDTSQLTNKELQLLTNRMRLESQFAELAVKQDQNYTQKQKNGLAEFGKSIVKELVKENIKRGMNSLIQNKVNEVKDEYVTNAKANVVRLLAQQGSTNLRIKQGPQPKRK